MAQRVVSGEHFRESWVELDAEIAAVEAQWLASRTSVYAAVPASPSSLNVDGVSQAPSELESEL